jgi:hypothetical protein
MAMAIVGAGLRSTRTTTRVLRHHAYADEVFLTQMSLIGVEGRLGTAE